MAREIGNAIDIYGYKLFKEKKFGSPLFDCSLLIFFIKPVYIEINVFDSVSESFKNWRTSSLKSDQLR